MGLAESSQRQSRRRGRQSSEAGGQRGEAREVFATLSQAEASTRSSEASQQ